MAPVSSTPFMTTLYTRVRLATREDVPHIHKLIYKMADYYHLANTFTATESSLSTHLFKSPPFESFTTFLAEVSTKPLSKIESPYFTPVERVVQIDRHIVDPDAESFKSTSGDDVVVVGFTLIFPNFSTFMGQPGFHLEDLFIREGHRGYGMGKMLLTSVASQTVKMGYGRVEWTVIDWNVRSHRFYERLGAKVLPDWRICRLSGDNLEAYELMETKRMLAVIDAPGIKGKTVKTLSNSKQSLIEFVQSIILNTQVTKDQFYVLDLRVVVELVDNWYRQLPMIKPFYAVKCNSELSLLGALAALGCNFDCASKAEIQSVLSLGVSPDRIVYANPCKSDTHLKYAASVGVNLTTFDSKYEIDKISKLHPNCQLLLRIKSLEDSASKWAPLGSKFGALPQEVEPLLKAAQAAGLTVSGVSFHIGSESTNPHPYRGAIASARVAFDTATRLGMPQMSVLNIGGGFTAGSFFDEAAIIIKSALQDYFSDVPGLKVISEPGRYFAETVLTLATSIIGKRVREETREYWLNDGVFGSFLCVAYGITPPACLPLALNSNRENPMCEGEPTYSSTLFGPTCDSVDKVMEGKQLPDLETNDWLVFPNMGAYSTACATSFNGFSPDVVFTYIVYSN